MPISSNKLLNFWRFSAMSMLSGAFPRPIATKDGGLKTALTCNVGLTVDHRVVIVMHYLLDMTLEQVAETLDVPMGTVCSRLSRAMGSMRAALGADGRSAAPRVGQEAVR